jgi:SAM-dependent methyltransferase
MSDAGGPSAHWEGIWQQGHLDEVSWFQTGPTVSLELAARVTDPTSSIVDVGGGASRLAEGLLDAGYTDITVLDVAAAAVGAGCERLGERAGDVRWLVEDVTTWEPGRIFDLWHDRAVLHFLTDQADRDRYVATLRQATAPGGHAIVATFGPDGPEFCSGLPVRRHDRDDLRATLGAGFEALDFVEEIHVTPKGAEQPFLYGLFHRTEAAA